MKRNAHYKTRSLHDRSLSSKDTAAKVVTDVYFRRFLSLDVVLVSMEDQRIYPTLIEIMVFEFPSRYVQYVFVIE